MAKKAATISGMTAGNKVYDGTTTATIDNSGDSLVGIIGGDAVTLNTSATANFSSPHVGTWTVTGSGFTLGNADAGNYALSQPTATATITARGLTVTANNASKTYGAADPSFTYTYNGEIGGDVPVFAGHLSRVAGENAGNYNINIGTLAATGDYTIGSFTAGAFTINKAALTVTADNKSMRFGRAMPTLTDTITGFVRGDTVSAVNGSALLTTNATGGSPVGNYAITAGLGSLTTANYNFSVFNNGTLTITAPPPVIVLPNSFNVPAIVDPVWRGLILPLTIRGPMLLSTLNSSPVTVSPSGAVDFSAWSANDLSSLSPSSGGQWMNRDLPSFNANDNISQHFPATDPLVLLYCANDGACYKL